MEDEKKKIILFASVGGAVLLLLVVLLIVVLTGGSQKAQGVHNSAQQLSPTAQQSDTNGQSDLQDSQGAELSQGLTSEQTGTGIQTSGTGAGTAGSVQSVGKTTKATTHQNGGTTVTNTPAVFDTTRYNFYTYTRPYWLGNTVYNEAVYPMTTKSGSNEVLQLLYPISKIVEVRSSDLKTRYQAGTDYKLENGKLVILPGSKIKVNRYENYYLSQPLADHSQKGPNGGYIYFSEGPTFHNAQIAVTYQHTTSWAGPVPKKQGAKLPRLQQLIADKGSLNVVFFGDSISCGANSSSTVGASPMTPKWAEMFVEGLEQKGVTVTDYNTSVGGQVSAFAVTNVQGKVLRYNPDLVVLGWGINDASAWNNTAITQYYDNMKAVIVQIRKAKPNCEIILIGSVLPNPEAVEFVGPVEQYTQQLSKLADDYQGVVLANMTEIHKYFLTRKHYRDLTGNNVNHPNDFVARLYTQVLMETISK